jgi:hypothetical protein
MVKANKDFASMVLEKVNDQEIKYLAIRFTIAIIVVAITIAATVINASSKVIVISMDFMMLMEFIELIIMVVKSITTIAKIELSFILGIKLSHQSNLSKLF